MNTDWIYERPNPTKIQELSRQSYGNSNTNEFRCFLAVFLLFAIVFVCVSVVANIKDNFISKKQGLVK